MKLNTVVHTIAKPYTTADATERWVDWCIFADAHKINEPEYLLPLAELETEVTPFSYEIAARITKSDIQLQKEIEAHRDWNYQMEFKDSKVSTRGYRADRDWNIHRYRGSLLIRNIAKILGANYNGYSILDVGCACGLFALEFAYQGSTRVVGLDLRAGNIRQARWLAATYGIPNAVFMVENARNLDQYRGFDIAFCAGLLYHVTFSMDLIKNLYECCDDFAILDSNIINHPFSAFNLILNRDVSYAGEGETSYEFYPTYRAVIDSLLAIGFVNVIEVVGSKGRELGGYGNCETRSFLAFKPGSKSFSLIKGSLNIKY